ncbi:DUF3772 domain-containing protein [Oceanicella actignis]|uniref:Small-conductance mechanosensitive channel n=1 Tax=Oceanicella actignis TaxID=1189325 RepID=A0A1M7TI86_9RHOB|nr:DUF3772 domain-containing protein [Oceanicella actignis]SET58197.1 Small-conductance mechanosensitive channel [Oceanicella actignis]SHN70391.1 Small-conductance mechanosensitive channel [Oceanicella actignis]
MKLKILRALLAGALLAVAALGAPATAREADPQRAEAQQVADWEALAARAEKLLQDPAVTTQELEELRAQLDAARIAARALAQKIRADADPVRAQLEALGPPPAEGATEAESVAAERAALNEKLAQIDGRARKAEQAAALADALIARIDASVRERFARELLTRGPTPLSPEVWRPALAETAEFGARVAAEVRQAWSDPVRARQREDRLPLLLGLVIAAAGAAAAMRARASSMFRRMLEGAGGGRRLLVAVFAATVRVLAPAAAAAGLVLILRHGGLTGATGRLLADALAPALIALLGARAIGLAYYAPYDPELRLSSADDREARSAFRATMLLGLALFCAQLFLRGGQALGLSPNTLAVWNLGVTALGATAMLAFARHVRPDPAAPAGAGGDDLAAEDEAVAEQSQLVRRAQALGALGLRLCAPLSVLLAAAGYYAASRYLTEPPILTVGLIGAGIVLQRLVRDAVEALVGGDENSGLRLIPILAGFAILCVELPLLALVWGARPSDLSEWWRMLTGGFAVGDVRLSPLDFLTFAVVLVLGVSATRLVQAVLRGSVLPNTRLDTGARAAVVSGVGYLGYTVAGLAAITATGLDLSNLAIVAGALSVGIGFGLQNIVSNFVSGVILLIERPVKTGDWIEVGGRQGTVRKIAVRATEIETFDRATLIVPNSELISSQVLNMTHGNTIGRVIVPVGVAYGSDVRKVERILLEIARAHPLTMGYPAPFVVFQGFGDSALNFEIRAYLRDVNTVVSVRSEMNFEIERRFREEGIEIPFPQRDLNLRNVDALRALLAERGAAGDGAPSGGGEGGAA